MECLILWTLRLMSYAGRHYIFIPLFYLFIYFSDTAA